MGESAEFTFAGTANASLVRLNVQPAQAGNYLLVVTNSAGSTTGAVAVLTVSNPDTDGDGMPDAWKLASGLTRNNPNDTILDTDSDGMTNLQEFRAGTNPTNAQSVLRLEWISLNPARLRFIAQPNISYSIQFNTNLSAGWFALSNVGAQSTARTAIVTDPNPTTNKVRFYRAVTP